MKNRREHWSELFSRQQWWSLIILAILIAFTITANPTMYQALLR